MSPKSLYYLAVFVGGLIGGYIPVLFGADILSFTSILTSGLGSLIGIIIVYKVLNH